MVRGSLLLFLTISDGFPIVPWINLSGEARARFLKLMSNFPHLVRYASTWNNPPLTFDLNEPSTMTLEMWRKQCRERLPSIPESDPIKSGFFAVNMKYGRRFLIEEFAKWLTHFEGKAMSETPPITEEISPPKKSPGRNSIRDTLNALAVMRLRFHCDTFSEAKRRMQLLKGKDHGMYYATRHNANRACNLALSHFRQMYGWLDSDNPLHFTKAWRGGDAKM